MRSPVCRILQPLPCGRKADHQFKIRPRGTFFNVCLRCYARRAAEPDVWKPEERPAFVFERIGDVSARRWRGR